MVNFTEKHDKNLKIDNTRHTHIPHVYALKYPNVLIHCNYDSISGGISGISSGSIGRIS